MELEAVEVSLGIQFPKLFHTIDKNGMMDYLIHSAEWDEDKFTAGREDAGMEDFFGQSMGDCVLIAFENIQSAYDELYECLNSDLDVYPERQSINPKYRLVPFARKISGEHEIYSDYIKAHIPWLNDEHQQLLAEVPIQDIWEQLPEPQDFNIWV